MSAPAKKVQALDLDDFEQIADDEVDDVSFGPIDTFGELVPGSEDEVDAPIGLTPPEVSFDIDGFDTDDFEPKADDADEARKDDTPVSWQEAVESDAANDTLEAFAADLPQDAGLYDYLASAREAAQTAQESEDRSRKALYDAVSHAFDFSVAADEAPEDYAELLEDYGLTAQARAPMTPIVKLVFGAGYDKTRLTEYAAVLSYARRVGIAKGGLAEYLSEADGGLKGVVNAERRWRKEQAGKDVEPDNEVRSSLAKKLRSLDPQDLSDIDSNGGEFGLVMIRRTEDGHVVVLGEIEQDIPLIERAARKLLG